MSFLHYLLALLLGFFSPNSENSSLNKQTPNFRNAPQSATTSSSNNQRKIGGPDRIGGQTYGPIIIIDDTHYKTND